jgi:lysine 2,3-aminomutase
VSRESFIEIFDGIEEKTRLPYGVSRYYASLAENSDPDNDPIAAQYIPRSAESIHLDYESPDPLADEQYSVAPRVIHHYSDRILILVNDRCATYCRHCFRRHFTGSSTGRITPEELDLAAEYLNKNPAVEEVLLSGGDPLMLSDEELFRIIVKLRDAAGERELMFRLATRMPVVLPARITPALAEGLVQASAGRIWLVTHANHPRELSEDFRRVAGLLVESGIPVLNQAVLLKGVNDSADVLEQLFRGLIKLRVKPYYLFQGDLASGTSHFRTSIDRGLDLMDELRNRLSGIAMPTYAVDLPGGGGKIPLERGRIEKRDENWYYLRGNDGAIYRYPVEAAD